MYADVVRNRFVFLALLSGFQVLDAAPSRAQPPPEDAATAVQRLVRALGADDFAAREQASIELALLGEPARAHLEAALDGLGPEARLRAEAVLEAITGPRRKLSSRREATLVDMVLDSVPLRDAAGRLARIGGCSVRFVGAGGGANVKVVAGNPPRAPDPAPPPADSRWSRPVTMTFAKVPFLQAVDMLCDEVGLLCNRDYMSGDLVLSEGRTEHGLVQYAGPWRIALTAAMITHQTRFTGAPITSASLQFRADIEPAVEIVGLLHPPRVPPARDDQDREVNFIQPTQQSHYLMPVDKRRQFFVAVSFEPPAKDARFIKSLILPLEAVMPDEIVTAEVPLAPEPPADEREEPPAAPALRVVSFQENGGTTTATVTFTAPVASGEPPLQNPPKWEDIQVVDARGVPVRDLAVRPQQDGSGRELRVLTFPTADAPVVRLRILSRWRVERVEATFENVPLP